MAVWTEDMGVRCISSEKSWQLYGYNTCIHPKENGDGYKDNAEKPKMIEVRSNGSYLVSGNIPLVSKTQIVSEYGEPLTWKKDGEIPAEEPYYLCRCGASSNKPFCDRSHRAINFDGTEMAPTDHIAERRETYPGM